MIVVPRRRGSRSAIASGALVLSWLSAGCAGVHLHSEANYQTVLKAQTTFEDAKIPASVAEERARLAQILQREFAAVRRQTLATRDAYLLAVLVGGTTETSWGQFDRAVAQRVEELRGKTAKFSDLDAVMTRLESTVKRLRDAEIAYGVRRPTKEDLVLVCPLPPVDPAKPLKFSSLSLRAAYEEYKTECDTITRLKAEAMAFGDGQWQKLMIALRDAEARRAATLAQVAQLKKEYAAAKEKHEAAVKAANTSEIKTQADKLKETLGKLGVLGAAGEVAALQEQIDSLNAILDALTKEVDPSKPVLDPALQTHLRIASFLPALEQRIGSAGKIPAVAPALLAAEHLRLQLADAQRVVATEDRRLDLLRRKAGAMFAEMALLNRADRWMKGVADLTDEKTKQKCVRASSFGVDFKGYSANCREQAVAALLLYADSWTIGRLPQYEIDHLLIGLRHVASLDASENALLQWQNLIGVPLGQLVAFHKGGITSEDLANLINAVGLGGIAVGVNRR